MKKLRYFIFILAILSFASCQSLMQQINSMLSGVKPPDPSNIVNNITNQATNTIQNVGINELDKNMKKLLDETKKKIDESYTVTDFNYAVSFGDNASYLENKQDYKNIITYTYYLVDPNTPKHIQARNHNTSGQIFYLSNSFSMAELSYLKAISIYESISYLDSTEAIQTMNNIGLLYLNMGKYTTAEQYFNEALKHRKNNNKDTVGYAATVNNLGVLYKINGDFSKSEKVLKEAMSFVEKNYGQNSIQYAVILNNLSMLYLNINKLEDAKETMTKCIDISERILPSKSTTLLRFKTNLSLIFKSQKEYKSAESILLGVLKTMKAQLGENHPDYATMLRILASLYMEMGSYSMVEKNLTDALSIYEKKFGKQNPQYGNTLFELAVYNQFIGKIDIAQTQFEQALEIQLQTLSDRNPAIAKTYEYLAINYWHNKDINNANNNFKIALDKYIFLINNFFDAMSEAEKTRFWAEYQPSFIRYMNFVAQNYNLMPEIAVTAYNYHLQTKAILLNNSRKIRSIIIGSNDKDLINKFNELNELKNYIAKLYSFTNEELKERKINLDSIIKVSENLEKEIVQKSSAFSQNIQDRNINYDALRNKLSNSEAAIEIVRLPYYNYEKLVDSIQYVSFILKNNSNTPIVVVNNEGKRMENDYYTKYAKSIGSGTDMGDYYNYYWQDIDKELKNISKIFLSVDGIYNRVNVNTFQMPDGKYVIENYFVYNLTNTKDIISLKDRLSQKTNLIGKNALLIGNPNYSLGLPEGYHYIPALPGTKVEVEEITKTLKQKNWNVVVYQQDQANEEKVKNIKSPFVLHIATHGYFIEKTTENEQQTRSLGVQNERAVTNPLLRSGLLFAGADKTVLNINDRDNTEIDDGILNSFEAITLNLTNTHLVVLSACQTGLGEIQTGEGVYGLQRAFQIAGTKTIVTSLWPVSDEGTQLLMQEFYKNWLESGDEFDAFHKSCIYIKNKLKYPFYWGAFVIIGK